VAEKTGADSGDESTRGEPRAGGATEPVNGRPAKLSEAGAIGRVRQATPYVTALALIASVAASVASSYPGHEHLPGIALNSGALYYIERAVVFFAGLMIALTLLARGLMAELPLKLGFGTGSLEYGQEVQRAAGGVRAAAEDLQAWTSDVNDRLTQLEDTLQKTTVLAAATARATQRQHEREPQASEPLDPGPQ
jgi:hypothetical protein